MRRTLKWVGAGVIALVIVGGLTLLPTGYDFRPWCDVSHDWTTAHAQYLPRTLGEFQAYPLELRPAIWAALDDRSQFDIQQQHLDYLLADSRISEATKSVIREIRPIYTVNFARQKNQDARDRVERFRTTGEAYPALTPALQRLIQANVKMKAVLQAAEVDLVNLMQMPVLEATPMTPHTTWVRLGIWGRNAVAFVFRSQRISASARQCDCPVSTECTRCGCWAPHSCEVPERCSPYQYCQNITGGCMWEGVDLCTAVCERCS